MSSSIAPANPGAARLRPGATIPALQVGQTGSLQATLGSLDNLLIKLQPGELDAALTALASALQGNGTSLGHNLVRANTYFQQMLPLWPTVVSNLNTLVPVANQFAASTPDILQILANQTTTAGTINDQASGVRQAIGGGEVLAGQTASLLDRHPAALRRPGRRLRPFLTAISQNPRGDLPAAPGLDAWANAWTRPRRRAPISTDPDRGRRQSGRPRAGRSRWTPGRRLPLGRAGPGFREPADLHLGRAP